MEPRKPLQSSSASSSTPGRAYASSVKTARSPAIAPVRPAPPGASSSGGVVLPKITPPSNPASRTISPGGSSKRMGWTTPRNAADPAPPSSRSSATPNSTTSRPIAPLAGGNLSGSNSNGDIGYWDNGAPTVDVDSAVAAEDDEAAQLSYMDQMYSKIQMLNAELDREREESRAKALNVEHQVELRERATLEATQRYGTLNVEESENFGVVGARVPLSSSWETNAATVNQKFRPHQSRSTSPPQPATVLGKDQLELCAALGKNAELRIRSREIERQADQASSVLEQTQRQMKMAERRIANREEKLRALLKEKLHWQNEMKDLREQVVEEKMRQVDLMRRLETMKRDTGAQLDAMAQTIRDFEEDNHALRAYLVETKGQLAAQTKRLDDVVKLAKEEKEKLTECIVEARGKFREWKETECVFLKTQKDQALNHMKAEYELKITRHQNEKQKLRDKVKDLEVSVRLMQKDRTLSPLELSLRKATILGSKDHAGTTEAELIEANVRIKELEALLEHSQEFQKKQESIIKVSEATISRLIQEREVAALDILANQRLPGSHTWSDTPANVEMSSVSPLAMSSFSTSSNSAMALSPRQLVASVRPQHKLPSPGFTYENASSFQVDPSPPPRQRVDPTVRPTAPPPRSASVMSPPRKAPNGRLTSKGSESRLIDAESTLEPTFILKPTSREKELVQQIEEMQTALHRALAAQTEKALETQGSESPDGVPDHLSMNDARSVETDAVGLSDVNAVRPDSDCSPVPLGSDEDITHGAHSYGKDQDSDDTDPPIPAYEQLPPEHVDPSKVRNVSENDMAGTGAPSSEMNASIIVQDDTHVASSMGQDAPSFEADGNNDGHHLLVADSRQTSGMERPIASVEVEDSQEHNATNSQVPDLKYFEDEQGSLHVVTSLQNAAGNEASCAIDVDVELDIVDINNMNHPQCDDKYGMSEDHLATKTPITEVKAEDPSGATIDAPPDAEELCSVQKIAECVVAEAEQSALSTLSRAFMPSARSDLGFSQRDEDIYLPLATVIATNLVNSVIEASVHALLTASEVTKSSQDSLPVRGPEPIISSAAPLELVQVEETEVMNHGALFESEDDAFSSFTLPVDGEASENQWGGNTSTGSHTCAFEPEPVDVQRKKFENHGHHSTSAPSIEEIGVAGQSAIGSIAIANDAKAESCITEESLKLLIRVKATSLVIAASAHAVGIVTVATVMQHQATSVANREAVPSAESAMIEQVQDRSGDAVSVGGHGVEVAALLQDDGTVTNSNQFTYSFVPAEEEVDIPSTTSASITQPVLQPNSQVPNIPDVQILIHSIAKTQITLLLANSIADQAQRATAASATDPDPPSTDCTHAVATVMYASEEVVGDESVAGVVSSAEEVPSVLESASESAPTEAEPVGASDPESVAATDAVSASTMEPDEVAADEGASPDGAAVVFASEEVVGDESVAGVVSSAEEVPSVLESASESAPTEAEPVGASDPESVAATDAVSASTMEPDAVAADEGASPDGAAVVFASEEVVGDESVAGVVSSAEEVPSVLESASESAPTEAEPVGASDPESVAATDAVSASTMEPDAVAADEGASPDGAAVVFASEEVVGDESVAGVVSSAEEVPSVLESASESAPTEAEPVGASDPESVAATDAVSASTMEPDAVAADEGASPDGAAVVFASEEVVGDESVARVVSSAEEVPSVLESASESAPTEAEPVGASDPESVAATDAVSASTMEPDAVAADEGASPDGAAVVFASEEVVGDESVAGVVSSAEEVPSVLESASESAPTEAEPVGASDPESVAATDAVSGSTMEPDAVAADEGASPDGAAVVFASEEVVGDESVARVVSSAEEVPSVLESASESAPTEAEPVGASDPESVAATDAVSASTMEPDAVAADEGASPDGAAVVFASEEVVGDESVAGVVSSAEEVPSVLESASESAPTEAEPVGASDPESVAATDAVSASTMEPDAVAADEGASPDGAAVVFASEEVVGDESVAGVVSSAEEVPSVLESASESAPTEAEPVGASDPESVAATDAVSASTMEPDAVAADEGASPDGAAVVFASEEVVGDESLAGVVSSAEEVPSVLESASESAPTEAEPVGASDPESVAATDAVSASTMEPDAVAADEGASPDGAAVVFASEEVVGDESVAGVVSSAEEVPSVLESASESAPTEAEPVGASDPESVAATDAVSASTMEPDAVAADEGASPDGAAVVFASEEVVGDESVAGVVSSAEEVPSVLESASESAPTEAEPVGASDPESVAATDAVSASTMEPDAVAADEGASPDGAAVVFASEEVVGDESVAGVVSSAEEVPSVLESASESAPTEAEPVGASDPESVAATDAVSASTMEPDAVAADDGARVDVAAVVTAVSELGDVAVLGERTSPVRQDASGGDSSATSVSSTASMSAMAVKVKAESWNDLVGGSSGYDGLRLSSERSSVPVVKSPVMALPDPSRYASAIVREMIRDPTLLAYDVKHEQAQPFALMDERILTIDQHARHMQHDENDKARVSVVNEGPSSRHTAAIEGVLVTKRKKMDDETRRKSIALRIIPAFNYEPVLIKFQWSDFVVATPIRLMSSGSQLNLLHSLGAGSTMNLGERGPSNIAVIEEAPKKQVVQSLVQKMRLIVKKGVKLPCGTYAIISVFIRPLEDGNENLRIQIYDSERVEEFQYDFHEDHLRDYVEEWTGSADEARAFFERLVFRSEQGSIIIKMPEKIRASVAASPEPSSVVVETEPRVYTPTAMSQLLTNLATTQPLELPPEPQYRLSPNAPTSPQRPMAPLEHQFSAPNRLESRVFIPRIEEDNESMASSVLKR